MLRNPRIISVRRCQPRFQASPHLCCDLDGLSDCPTFAVELQRTDSTHPKHTPHHSLFWMTATQQHHHGEPWREIFLFSAIGRVVGLHHPPLDSPIASERCSAHPDPPVAICFPPLDDDDDDASAVTPGLNPIARPMGCLCGLWPFPFGTSCAGNFAV